MKKIVLYELITCTTQDGDYKWGNFCKKQQHLIRLIHRNSSLLKGKNQIALNFKKP